jgi:hypothetical protein
MIVHNSKFAAFFDEPEEKFICFMVHREIVEVSGYCATSSPVNRIRSSGRIPGAVEDQQICVAHPGPHA